MIWACDMKWPQLYIKVTNAWQEKFLLRGILIGVAEGQSLQIPIPFV